MAHFDNGLTDPAGARLDFPSEPDSEHRLPALLSVVLHATLLIACGLLAPTSASPPEGDSERVVGIAVVARHSPTDVQYLTERSVADATSAADSGSGADRLPQAESLRQITSQSGIGLPADREPVAASQGLPGLPSTELLTRGANQAGAPAVGGQTRTQVFGAQGVGSEFVYVFDRSSSMGGFGGRPLAAAKRELQRSLADLTAVNQFQIVFYNEAPSIFNPFRPNPPQMLPATEDNRQLAIQYVQGMSATGGTHHRDALEFALKMGPDVIFFLTDADEPGLSARELADLRRRNRAATIIHTIEFGAGSSLGRENFLVRLARQNGGQHVYVDVASLPVER